MLTSWRHLRLALQGCTSVQSLSIFDDVAFITAVCGAVLHTYAVTFYGRGFASSPCSLFGDDVGAG